MPAETPWSKRASGKIAAQQAEQSIINDKNNLTFIISSINTVDAKANEHKDMILTLHSIVESNQVQSGIKQELLGAKVQSDIVGFKTALSSMSAKMDGQLQSFSTILDDWAGRTVSNDVFRSSITELNSRISSMEQSQSEFKDEINRLINQFASRCDLKIQQLADEIANKPSEIPAVKDELNTRIDVVSMDSSNAILRSSNCEKHLQLIEKKIENLYLLIKKFDLDRSP